jgi:hypothetical protein
MTSPAFARRVATLAGWVLPILAVVLLAPGQATASCGDYVAWGPDQATHHPTPAEPDRPCTGPSCSQAPHVPLTPVPPAPVRPAQEWGDFGALLGFEPPGHTTALAEPAAARPVRRPSDVYHPPRPPAFPGIA